MAVEGQFDGWWKEVPGLSTNYWLHLVSLFKAPVKPIGDGVERYQPPTRVS